MQLRDKLSWSEYNCHEILGFLKCQECWISNVDILWDQKLLGIYTYQNLLDWPSDYFDMFLNAHIVIKLWSMSIVLCHVVNCLLIMYFDTSKHYVAWCFMSKFYGKLFNIFVVSHLSANHKYDNLHMQIDMQKDFDLSWVGRLTVVNRHLWCRWLIKIWLEQLSFTIIVAQHNYMFIRLLTSEKYVTRLYARLICSALLILSFGYNFIQMHKIVIQEEN